MKIRKAKYKDVDGIYAVLLDMLKAEDLASQKSAKHFLQVRKRKDDFERCAKRELLKEIREANSIYIVAEENKEILAYARGAVSKNKDPFFKPIVIGHFQALCVRNKHRGKKIASALNKKMDDWFKEKHCKLVYLEAFSKNPAVPIYKNWGYETIIYKMGKKL